MVVMVMKESMVVVAREQAKPEKDELPYAFIYHHIEPPLCPPTRPLDPSPLI